MVTTLMDWFVAEQLNRLGWPQTKGVFRKKEVVPALLVDLTVEQGLRLCMGLGAGRPELACRVIADIFRPDAWTPQQTAALLGTAANTQKPISEHPELPAWTAFYGKHALSLQMAEAEWGWLGKEVASLWRGFGGYCAIWGLSHQMEFAAAFEASQIDDARNAPEMRRQGLAVAPPMLLNEFYVACEQMVFAYESSGHRLPDTPAALRESPLVVARRG